MTVWIRSQVARAARDIAPLWPLHSFIALNPLAAHEHAAFAQIEHAGVAATRPHADYLRDFAAGRITIADLEAALTSQIPELSGVPGVQCGSQTFSATELLIAELTTPELQPPADVAQTTPVDPHLAVDDCLVKWLAAYLDPDPAWLMPRRAEGLYAAWRHLVRFDTALPRAARRALRQLPSTAEASLTASLHVAGVASGDTADVLRAELASLPGWVSHMKWREEQLGDIDLLDYLAIRMATKVALGASPASASTRTPVHTAGEVWQRSHQLAQTLGFDADTAGVAACARVLALHPRAQHRFTLQLAYELHYRRDLLGSLSRKTAVSAAPTMQFIACIDPRSEGIRRHLEAAHPGIETLGFAGFFGVPFRFSSLASAEGIDVLPALLSPRHRVTETASAGAPAARWLNRLHTRRAFSSGFHAAESSPAAPYALAELAGPLMGVGSLLKTVAPLTAARWSRRLRQLWAPKPPTMLTVADAFSLEERIGLAEAALRTMGLDHCAPLVVLCGHGSTSTNNLYQSAQQCGACGGHPGDANARAAAALLNDREVRAALRNRGLTIPVTTHFVAAEHDTVTDRIEVLDPHLVPPSHRSFVQQFTTVAARATAELVRERAPQLPGVRQRSSAMSVLVRSVDWAEVYPEWGLAGNAAIVVGPRELTAGVCLDRRVFLHSYRPHVDVTGAGLETILTAPVIVAQWINHQYYFSALNPDSLGAGTKTTHNAIGTIGVLSGQSGDLRRGLPWQSVGVGDTLVHEAMRLAVVVEAPLERITAIIDRNPVLRSLCDNEWISLTARADADSPWRVYGPYGWQSPSWLPADDLPTRPSAPGVTTAPAPQAPAAGVSEPTRAPEDAYV